MSNDPLIDRLGAETQPELDRMHAEHERMMRLIAQLPEPSDADRRAIARMNSPEGWQNAIKEVISEASTRRPKVVPLAVIVIILALICGAFLWLCF